MSDKKIFGISKGTFITAVIVLCIILIAPICLIYESAVGPKEITDSALLDEQVIRYKGNDYYYVGSKNSDIKSGRCIKYGMFEQYYLNEGGNEYIIRSSLHERHIFKREDLLENIYKLAKRGSENSIMYEDNKLIINGEEYKLIDTFDKFEGRTIFYELYCSIGKVSFNSQTVDVDVFKDDFDCNFMCIEDNSFMCYVFAKTDVDMDAYMANDVSKVTSFYVNTKDRGNKKYDNSDVLNALKSLRVHDGTFLCGDIYDCRPQGERIFFDLIFDDLPVCYKCRINVTLSDDGVYYNIEDGTQDCYNIYKVSDSAIENAVRSFAEEFSQDSDY